ncbi:MAG: RimK family alpha-L-glutamate ligase [Geminicoccaceae bacterium]
MATVYVLHENAEWLPPLREAFERQDIDYVEWDLSSGSIELAKTPPECVFYNRMSASSFTRDHRFAPEFTAAVLNWLEGHGRMVVNDSRALALEINKVGQYARLSEAGIQVPETFAALGRDHLEKMAERLGPGPWVLKPNRGGKGHGVVRFDDKQGLLDHIRSDAFEDATDGISLIQRYVEAAEPFITRAEFIGGKFYYAVRVDTSDGFELCPADVCAIDGAPPKFQITGKVPDDLISKLEAWLPRFGIGAAGVEFVTDPKGQAWVYDVNTNTNYNADAEAGTGLSGMGRLAAFLGEQARSLARPAAA